ncbi:MAG: MazG-like family protein [Halobacteriales archaeon]|nr:MazG-like family protein [Halobacteriales archaeon]
MDDQARVANFIEEHDLSCPPAYRLLDLSAEVGELAADAADSSDYGANPDALSVKEDELGDALFALLALCESLDTDAQTALDTALEKYDRRLSERGDAGSQ